MERINLKAAPDTELMATKLLDCRDVLVMVESTIFGTMDTGILGNELGNGLLLVLQDVRKTICDVTEKLGDLKSEIGEPQSEIPALKAM